MAREKKAEQPLSEDQVTALLRDRFAAPEFAYLPHVRNGTGWTRRTTRTADGLAMGLWPSRGLELHGFEIKSDRKDWLNEKANPEKAEEICRFCDRWWLAVGREDIVQPGELPATWGLLVPRRGKLVVKVEAPKLEAKPLDRVQLAAILRKASEALVPKVSLTEEMELRIQQAREEAQADLEAQVKARTRSGAEQLERLEKTVAAFEAASGVRIANQWQIGAIGQAVAFIRSGGVQAIRTEIEHWRDRTNEISARLNAVLDATSPTTKTGTDDR